MKWLRRIRTALGDRRWFWVVCGGLLLAASLILAPRLYVADLEEALVREANEVVAAPRLRPVHVDVAHPGSFVDALREPLPRHEKGWKALARDEAEGNLLSAVAKGERPLADLTPAMRAGLSSLEPDLETVLSSTHAERADLGPDHDPFGPWTGASWLGVQTAAKHAAIRIRTALTSSDSTRVRSDCVDGLALGRDTAVSGGLIGRMIRSAVVGILAPACGELLADLSLEDARDAAARLRRIRDAVPSFAAMLREEGIQVQLLTYGRGLSVGARAQLLERPRAFAADGSMALDGVLGALRSLLAWRELRAFHDEVVAVGMLPAPERDAAFAALGRAHRLLWLVIGRLDGPGVVETWARCSRIDAAAELRLDLLVAAVAAREFRERRGRWPSSVADLTSAGLLQPQEAVRLSRLLLAEEAKGTAFQLTLPLPGADRNAPSDAVVRVR